MIAICKSFNKIDKEFGEVLLPLLKLRLDIDPPDVGCVVKKLYIRVILLGFFTA